MSEEKKGPYIIGFNGPPHSGKDTIADLLVGQLGRVYDIAIHRCILAAPMRARVEALVGDGTKEWYAREKDKPVALLNGMTPRQMMIADSEETLKPQFGQDLWAKMYHYRNRHWWNHLPAIVVVSDIGFESEVKYFCEHSTAYLNVMLSRTGTDWSKDSRNYVAATEHGGLQFMLDNDSFKMAAVHRLAEHIATLGWKL